MRSIIRDNYIPHPGDYHDRLVFDSTQHLFWLFDCDGVYWDGRRFGPRVVDELGDSELDVLSQKFTTEQLKDIRQTIEALSTATTAELEAIKEQIQTLVDSTDVKDVVGTYAELEAYPTATLGLNDIIKVLKDETNDNATTYYRWDGTEFKPIGSIGPYYTTEEVDTKLEAVDTKLEEKQDTLVAGENIKTLNGESILGEGNIVIRGGGEPTMKLDLTYYTDWDITYDLNFSYNCTVNFVDSDKLKAFCAEHNIDSADFNYQETWDPETGQPTGTYVWQVWASGEIAILPEDMAETTGIDVTVTNPDQGYASMNFNRTMTIGKQNQDYRTFLVSELGSLCNGNEYTMFTGEATDGTIVEVPRGALVNVNVSSYNGAPLTDCPNSFLTQAYNLTGATLSFTRIGDNVLHYAGSWADRGVSVWFSNAKEIGSDCLSNAKVNYLSAGGVKTVGSSFLSGATCSFSTLLLGSIETAGNGFFQNARSTDLGITPDDHFPRLTQVGNAAFYGSKVLASTTFSSLLIAGSSFLSNAKYWNSDDQALWINLPQLLSLGDNAFNSTTVAALEMPKVTTLPAFFLDYAMLQGTLKLDLRNITTRRTVRNGDYFSGMRSKNKYARLEIYMENLGILDDGSTFKFGVAGDPLWDSSAGRGINLYGNNAVYLMENLKQRKNNGEALNVYWADLEAPTTVGDVAWYRTTMDAQTVYAEMWKLPSGFYAGANMVLAKGENDDYASGEKPLSANSQIQVIRCTEQTTIIIERGVAGGLVMRAGVVVNGVLDGGWKNLLTEGGN